MHLLFATSIVPGSSLGSGYEIATAAIIGSLRRNGARVTVLGYCWPGVAPADPAQSIVLGEIDVRTEGASQLRKAGWLMRALTAGRTFASAKLTEAPPAQVREAIRRAGPFDAYVVNSVQIAGAYPDLFSNLPMIFVAHNVEHAAAGQSAAASESGLQRILYRREARLLREHEARLCAQARFVFTLAEEDRAPLGVQSPERSAFLPLVTRATPPSPPSKRAIDYDAALIGTWSWQPNRIGLDWFLHEVTPHLDPSLRIRIAGHVPQGIVISHPGVVLAGRVDSAEAFVRAAAVVPLVSRAGSGVQLKTIETFEQGLPAVATSSSLRGIGSLPVNCARADTAVDFAAALQRAVRDPPGDVDGRGFYHGQRAALDAAVRAGLEHVGLKDDRIRMGVLA